MGSCVVRDGAGTRPSVPEKQTTSRDAQELILQGCSGEMNSGIEKERPA